MKKILSVVLVVALVFAMTASIAEAKDVKDLKLGFILGSREHAFYLKIEEGINAAAADLGFKAIVDESDLQGAIATERIEGMVVEGLDAISLACNEPAACTIAIEQAVSANKPRSLSLNLCNPYNRANQHMVCRRGHRQSQRHDSRWKQYLFLVSAYRLLTLQLCTHQYRKWTAHAGQHRWYLHRLDLWCRQCGKLYVQPWLCRTSTRPDYPTRHPVLQRQHLSGP